MDKQTPRPPKLTEHLSSERNVVSNKQAFIPSRFRPWIAARQRWGLSHAHIQMARALGLNPNMIGKLANHRQKPWKAPLSDFIERLYVKRFGKLPNPVRTIEEIAAAEMEKRRQRKLRKLAAKVAQSSC